MIDNEILSSLSSIHMTVLSHSLFKLVWKKIIHIRVTCATFDLIFQPRIVGPVMKIHSTMKIAFNPHVLNDLSKKYLRYGLQIRTLFFILD